MLSPKQLSRQVEGMIDKLSPRGFSCINLLPKQKKPFESRWTDLPFRTADELKLSRLPNYNLGVRLGSASKIGEYYAAIIDVDIRKAEFADEANEALQRLIPARILKACAIGKSGSGGLSRHYWVLTDKPLPTRMLAHSKDKYTDKKGHKHYYWEIECLGTGKQAMIPPSIHPSGGQCGWERRLDLERIEADLYPILTEEDRSAWKDEKRLTVSERLDDVDFVCADEDEVERLLQSLSLVNDGEYYEDYDKWKMTGMAIHHHFQGDERGFALWREFSSQSKKYKSKNTLNKWRSFDGKKDNVVTIGSLFHAVSEAEILASFDTKSSAEDAWDSPDMSIFEQTSEPPPPAPVEILGPVWERRIKDWASNASAPVGYTFTATIVAASAVIGNTRRIQLREGWVEPCCLWGFLIGTPSCNKSPAIDAIIRCCHKVEKSWNVNYSAELEKYLEAEKVADLKHKHWEKAVASAIKRGEDEPELPEECRTLTEPAQQRLIVSDATPESLVRIIAACRRGLFLVRDELGGFISDFTRYSKSSSRSFYIECYGGRSYTVDRVKDGGKPIQLENLTINLLGTIQPEVLADIMGDADDGFLARAIPIWEEPVPHLWHSGVVEDTAADYMFSQLGELTLDDNGKPVVLPLSPEAAQYFGEWYENRKAGDGLAHGLLASAYGKAPGHVARIALVLEHMWAFEPFSDADVPTSISLRAVKAAILIREEFIKPMQVRTYAMYSNERKTGLYKLACKILKDLPPTISASEIRNNKAIGQRDAKAVSAVLKQLQGMGWIRPIESEGKLGAPQKKYEVNPALKEKAAALINGVNGTLPGRR